jgi:hypothetical protein
MSQLKSLKLFIKLIMRTAFSNVKLKLQIRNHIQYSLEHTRKEESLTLVSLSRLL